MTFYSFACYRGTSFRSYGHSITSVGAETRSATGISGYSEEYKIVLDKKTGASFAAELLF